MATSIVLILVIFAMLLAAATVSLCSAVRPPVKARTVRVDMEDLLSDFTVFRSDVK